MASGLSGDHELDALFTFANGNKRVVSFWVDDQGVERNYVAYQNCVSCGKQRFTQEQLESMDETENRLMFCAPCYTTKFTPFWSR